MDIAEEFLEGLELKLVYSPRRLLRPREEVFAVPRVRGRAARGGSGQGVRGVLGAHGGPRPLQPVQLHGRLPVLRRPHEEVRRVQVLKANASTTLRFFSALHYYVPK